MPSCPDNQWNFQSTKIINHACIINLEILALNIHVINVHIIKISWFDFTPEMFWQENFQYIKFFMWPPPGSCINITYIINIKNQLLQGFECDRHVEQKRTDILWKWTEESRTAYKENYHVFSLLFLWCTYCCVTRKRRPSADLFQGGINISCSVLLHTIALAVIIFMSFIIQCSHNFVKISLWYRATTKIFLQQKFPDLWYMATHSWYITILIIKCMVT